MMEKKEYTAEEKALFIAKNGKITSWFDKELLKNFAKICKKKDTTMKDALTTFMQKQVEKNKDLLDGDK